MIKNKILNLFSFKLNTNSYETSLFLRKLYYKLAPFILGIFFILIFFWSSIQDVYIENKKPVLENQKKQLLIIPSEDLAQKTDAILSKVFEFLDLPYFKIKDFTKHNKREYLPMKNETRELLIEFYQPYNEKLYSLISQHFDWDK